MPIEMGIPSSVRSASDRSSALITALLAVSQLSKSKPDFSAVFRPRRAASRVSCDTIIGGRSEISSSMALKSTSRGRFSE